MCTYIRQSTTELAPHNYCCQISFLTFKVKLADPTVVIDLLINPPLSCDLLFSTFCVNNDYNASSLLCMSFTAVFLADFRFELCYYLHVKAGF